LSPEISKASEVSQGVSQLRWASIMTVSSPVQHVQDGNDYMGGKLMKMAHGKSFLPDETK
jgi:hypothetical protein